jgi:hypothetical protein
LSKTVGKDYGQPDEGRIPTPGWGIQDERLDMNARERVLAAVNHRQPDKIPFDLGAHGSSTLHVSCVKQLREHYKLPDEPVTTLSVVFMTSLIPDDLAQRMGVDTAAAISRGGAFGMPREDYKLWMNPDGQEIWVPGMFNPTPDGEGGWFAHPQGDTSCPPSGHMPSKCPYFDFVEPKVDFDDETLDPADNLEEYSVLGEKDLRFIVRSVEAAYRTGRAVLLTAPGTGLGSVGDITGAGLKNPKGIRTFEECYVSPIIRPAYVQEVFDRQTDIAVINLRNINDACGDKIDVVHICSNDFGHQTGQFVRATTFREIWTPYYRKLTDWIHANTKWKVLKHCCGSVAPLIPCFIEAGFDILNPLQSSAADMDPARLKREFGRDIVLWGGGVDTQKVLPFGSPDDVRRQVLERCEIFATDGGFVFSPEHNVQKGVPIENIVAMIDAVREFNGER